MNGKRNPILSAVFAAAAVLIPPAAVARDAPRITAAPARTVASYNIYTDFTGEGWMRRRQAVFDFFGRHQFDVFGLQEATEFQIADFLKSLPGYHHVIGNRSDGLRDDLGWYEFNPIFYRADRYRALRSGAFSISDAPTVPGALMSPNPQPRTATWAIFEDKRDGQSILVVNLHMSGNLGKAMDREIEVILSETARLGFAGPTLFMGDFNMTPDSTGHARMTAATKDAIVDLRTIAGRTRGPERTAISGRIYGIKALWYDQNADVRVDYMFGCGVREVHDYSAYPNPIDEAERIFASDHHAISVSLGALSGCKLR
jgi:endonuclease/exonuclease/phosphatase family metal-dependent hydrolase